jgi:hypothetical protein
MECCQHVASSFASQTRCAHLGPLVEQARNDTLVGVAKERHVPGRQAGETSSGSVILRKERAESS